MSGEWIYQAPDRESHLHEPPPLPGGRLPAIGSVFRCACGQPRIVTFSGVDHRGASWWVKVRLRWAQRQRRPLHALAEAKRPEDMPIPMPLMSADEAALLSAEDIASLGPPQPGEPRINMLEEPTGPTLAL